MSLHAAYYILQNRYWRFADAVRPVRWLSLLAVSASVSALSGPGRDSGLTVRVSGFNVPGY